MLKRRIVLAAPGLALLAVLVPTLLLADRLPDPLASHWSFSGEADSSMGLTPLTAFVAVAVSAAWALLVRQAVARGSELRLTVAPWVWGAVTFAAGLQLTTLAANVDVADWRAAELPAWALVATFAATALAAVAAHLLEREHPVSLVTASVQRPTVGLRSGERAVWSARVQGRWALAGAAVIGVGLIAAALASGNWWLAAIGALAALAAATVSEIVATVDQRGLTIAYGPLGWPRQHVPLEDIAEAEQIDIDPWRVGGWGVRKVPRRPGATAVVIRAGEGIQVRRRDGRDLLVTVPDAGTAAGLLNDLSAR